MLPSNVAARVAVEAGIADYWFKYVGLKGAIVGMTGYGESAPADKLFRSLALPPRILWQKRVRVPRDERCLMASRCRMLIAGCDADASYPAYSVLSGLHVPPFCLTGNPQRGPGVSPCQLSQVGSAA